jgi:hypothetical protein
VNLTPELKDLVFELYAEELYLCQCIKLADSDQYTFESLGIAEY